MRIPGLWVIGSEGAVKINVDQIAYCYHNNDITQIHYTCGRISRTRVTLKKLEQRLCREKFFRCHRNFIVNVDSIGGMSGNGSVLLLFPRKEIPVSRRKRNRLLMCIERNLKSESLYA